MLPPKSTTLMLKEVPLTIGEAIIVTPALRTRLLAEKNEIEALGVKVTAVQLDAERLPARYFIEFPSGSSYALRTKLEDARFDVGQQMGERMLRFYATKRVIEGKGWE